MSYPPIIVRFLGTGTSSGIPMIGCHCEVCQSTNPKDKRLRSSILVQSGKTTLVVDCGPDFRQQMLVNKVDKLDAVLLTHSHKDHIAGLDDVRAYNYFQKTSMEVFATTATQERVKMEFDYAFEDFKYPGVPSIHLRTIIEDAGFLVKDISITPIPIMHLNMPVLGFRFGDFTYITDANFIDDAAKEKIKGSKIIVLNALRKTPHISHFTLNEAITIADELEIPLAYFTHLSHQMGLHDVVEKELPSGRHLAFDGLEISI